jgi:hypothetical protein
VENYKWLANMINTVANTSFNVPPYTPPDNQSNQTNGSAPGQLFFDGFENGMGAWTLSKQSNANYWAAATDTPYQGAYYALGKPMSTTNPATTMQVAISTANYSNVTVSYYRRLVLTALNDFEAQWFDGTNWNVMESSHGTVFNDAAYAYKQYVLPASAGNNPAFMIRFQCTASAVSKTCKLDNVNVTAS